MHSEPQNGPRCQPGPRPSGPLRHGSTRAIWIAVGIVSLAAAIGGCDPRVAGTSGPEAAIPEAREAVDQTDRTTGAEAAEQETKKPSVTVSIEPWEKIVKAATAEGRPAVIDVWSLSCEPCLKAFPGLVRLHKELGDQVKCVSANVDFDGRRTRPPEHYESRVRNFLRLQRSTLANYISATPSDEVYAELDIPSIPAVLVFDADGNEAARFVDAGETIGFTYRDDVIPFVRTMIAGEKPSAAGDSDGDDRPNP